MTLVSGKILRNICLTGSVEKLGVIVLTDKQIRVSGQFLLIFKLLARD